MLACSHIVLGLSTEPGLGNSIAIPASSWVNVSWRPLVAGVDVPAEAFIPRKLCRERRRRLSMQTQTAQRLERSILWGTVFIDLVLVGAALFFLGQSRLHYLQGLHYLCLRGKF